MRITGVLTSEGLEVEVEVEAEGAVTVKDDPEEEPGHNLRDIDFNIAEKGEEMSLVASAQGESL